MKNILHDFNVFLNSMFYCEFFASKISHNNINKKEFHDTKVIMAISYEYSFTMFFTQTRFKINIILYTLIQTHFVDGNHHEANRNIN